MHVGSIEGTPSPHPLEPPSLPPSTHQQRQDLTPSSLRSASFLPTALSCAQPPEGNQGTPTPTAHPFPAITPSRLSRQNMTPPNSKLEILMPV